MWLNQIHDKIVKAGNDAELEAQCAGCGEILEIVGHILGQVCLLFVVSYKRLSAPGLEYDCFY